MEREKKIYRNLVISTCIMLIFAAGFLGASLFAFHTFRNVCIAIIMIDFLFVGYAVGQYFHMKRMITQELEDGAFEKSQILKTLVKATPIPYMLTDTNGQIMWISDPCQEILKGKKEKNISQMFETIRKRTFPLEDSKAKHYHVELDGKLYEVEGRKVDFPPVVEGKEAESVLTFYFYDETEKIHFKNESESKNLVVGLIYIDNYEEVLDTLEEVRQSMLFAVVERKIFKYMKQYYAIVKKFERDKYIFVFEAKYLPAIMEDRFSIMEDVRNTSMGNTLNVTLSIGIGANMPDYVQAYENARSSIDMALGRGGDQTVVKDGESVIYYGGNSQKTEKNTRVKARVKAHALRELMLLQSKVFIMGHKNPDADSIGAALGIYRMAKTFQKEAYIVVDADFPAIRPIVDGVRQAVPEEVIFINHDQALQLKDSDCVVVVVDTNTATMTEFPALLKGVNSVVVLDHHRTTKDTIKNAVLSYIEPYASSTCEMVAEVLQYIADKPKLRVFEADALYSGILVDTDNFVVKAGVRTFEAAAYLRRAGADVTRVRKMFREDLEQNRIKAYIIQTARMYMDEFAISSLEGDGITGATVIGAKAANELLDVQGVRGSFVLTKVSNCVYVSARSIDDLNVHMIMERMGGGGHLTVAATQIKDKSIDQVREELENLIAQMKENKEI